MYILIILALLSLLFQRPMALGNEFTFYGLIVLFFISLIVYSNSRRKDVFLVNSIIFKRFAWVMFPVLLFRVLNGGDLRECLNIFLSLFSLILLLNSKKKIDFFFSAYCWLVFILCCSSIITSIAFLQIPMEQWNQWFLGEMSIERNNFHYNFFFPFTMSQMAYNIPPLVVLRCNHFFGEPGIAPCFITAAIILTLHKKKSKWRYLKFIVYILGIITTYSTTGAAVLFAGLSVYYLSKGKLSFYKMFIFCLMALIGILIFLYMPGFGLIDKAESEVYGGNVEARYNNLQNFDFMIYAIATGILYVRLLPLKENKRMFTSMLTGIFLGSLANIIFFTTLFNAFLLYDDSSRD